MARKHFPERIAFERGFRVSENGELKKPNGQPHRTWLDRGYPTFNIQCVERNCACHVHRLQAYQKYGEQIYAKGLECRHLDSNRQNNTVTNIELGTPKQNAQDKSLEVRMRVAALTSIAMLKHDYPAIRKYYAETRSYLQTMRAFGVSSKGTLHYILKGSISKSGIWAGISDGSKENRFDVSRCGAGTPNATRTHNLLIRSHKTQ